jgi:hypothetical protein
MFRDEIGSCSEPPRPLRKTPWALIGCVVLAGLGLAHVAGLTKPLAAVAVQLGLADSRDVRGPAGRLVGEWKSEDDPMFRRLCHWPPEKSYHVTGVYMAETSKGMGAVIYKVVSEDRSGTNLVMAEYLGPDQNYQVRYSIAEDGRSMTREYDTGNGRHVSCQYRYVGPPPESLRPPMGSVP